jgi:hypothetical protein
MPKVTYCRTAADDYAELERLVKSGAVLEHGSVKSAGEKMKTMCASTFNSKVKHPERLTLEELREVKTMCKLDKAALLEVLRRILQ